MNDRDKRASASEIQARINKARAKAAVDQHGEANAKAVGIRVGIDLFAGVLFGVVSGIFLDRWLGTSPWLLIVMMLLGFSAGIRNVIRTAELESKKDRSRKQSGPEN
ncbi:MAG: AtpZ/AtpI family protein [Alphaproteobacteria bacterium]